MKTLGFIGLGIRGKPMAKTLLNALDTAHECGVPIPHSAQVLEMMQALKVAGHAREDHGGLVQFYEQLAHCEVRKPA
jgi:2-hydroxy-3-oxopropionate reductase